MVMKIDLILRWLFMRRSSWLIWTSIFAVATFTHYISMYYGSLRVEEARKKFEQKLSLYEQQLREARMQLKKKDRDLYFLFKFSNQSSIVEYRNSLPSSLDFLPHLFSVSGDFLEPAISFPLQNFPRAVDLVIGIPTVPRVNYSYIVPTLQSVLSGMSKNESISTRIVLMIADEKGPNSIYVQSVLELLKDEFSSSLNSGLLQIIVPSAKWYPPDLDSVPSTFNDSADRIHWRTKQNLDYVYLMAYCQQNARFYMQLEDDVLAKSGFISKIHNFIAQNTAKAWFMLEFSSLGFIGKLFRASDLPIVIQFIVLFHREKPVDWLLDLLFSNKFCSPERSHQDCSTTINSNFRLRMRPSLFQHVGLHSSLRGKLQALREKDYGKTQFFVAHKNNPRAKVTTTLAVYQKYSISNAYNGVGFFWSFSPKPNDYILIEFERTIMLRRFICRTGNPEHQSDILDNTTMVSLLSATNRDYDGAFVNVANFSNHGSAQIEFKSPVEVNAIKIIIRKGRPNWIIINEIGIDAE